MTAQPNERSVRTNVEVLQETYEAVGRGDIPALLNILTDDVEWTLQGPYVIPFAGIRRGREEVAVFFSLVGETLEFQRFGPRKYIGQDDIVVVLGYEHNLIKPTGAPSNKSGHTFTRSGTARSPSSGLLKTQRHTLSCSMSLPELSFQRPRRIRLSPSIPPRLWIVQETLMTCSRAMKERDPW